MTIVSDGVRFREVTTKGSHDPLKKSALNTEKPALVSARRRRPRAAERQHGQELYLKAVASLESPLPVTLRRKRYTP